jgi:surface polysaccharide O-acyltransferase-like enzyme
MSIGVAMEAAGFFALLSGVELRHAGLTQFLSRASFCVYLMHMFVLYAGAERGWSILLLPCAVSIPLAALGTLAVSCGVYFVLSKIPIVKRYLV